MRIKSLRLKNFCQFKGDTTIYFSYDQVKNVTIILGDNTFGKTQLLNAFNWCLYGVKAPSINSLLNYELANEMRRRGDEQIVLVELTLLHADFEYVLTREQKFFWGNGIVPQATSNVTLKYMRWGTAQFNFVPEPRIKNTLENILPKDLASYFFIGTEQISAISTPKNLKEAVKRLLGLAILESAQAHLGDVIKRFKSSIQTDQSNRLREIQNVIKTTEERIAKYDLEISKLEQSLNESTKRKEKLDNMLRNSQSTDELQREQRADERELKRAENLLEQQIRKAFTSFNRDSRKFFALPLIKVAREYLKNIKTDDYNGIQTLTAENIRELVEEILNRHQCICGQEIYRHSDAYNHLLETVEEISLHSVANFASKYPDMLGALEEQYSDQGDTLYRELQNAPSEFDVTREQIRRLKTDLDRINQQLKSQANVQKLLVERDNLRRTISNDQKALKDYLTRRGEQQKVLNIRNKEFTKLSSSSQANRKIQLRIQYAEKIREWISETLNKNERELRQRLESKVNEIFGKMYHGSRRVDIDDKYKIELLTSLGSNEKSEGLTVVENFAFIAGLVALTKEKVFETNSSESYPLVIDAPFSKTDETHISHIASVLPDIFEQVIIFVLQKDWSHAKPEISERLGKEYHLRKVSETYTQIV